MPKHQHTQNVRKKKKRRKMGEKRDNWKLIVVTLIMYS